MSRGGTGRSAGHEGGGGGGGGNSATPNSVFTPGTGTAHLLLQLRRDWAQQQQQGPPQQQQLSQGGSGGAAPPPPPPLESGDGVGSVPAGEENLSEDAAALIMSCSYAVAPDGGGGGSDANFCDQRGRPATTSGAAAAAAGGKGGAARAPRGASSSRRDERRAAAPASCGGRRGRGGSNGKGGSNGNGAQKPALASTAAAEAAFGGNRPRKQAVGVPAGVGSTGLAAGGSGMPYSGEAAPVRMRYLGEGFGSPVSCALVGGGRWDGGQRRYGWIVQVGVGRHNLTNLKRTVQVAVLMMVAPFLLQRSI